MSAVEQALGVDAKALNSLRERLNLSRGTPLADIIRAATEVAEKTEDIRSVLRMGLGAKHTDILDKARSELVRLTP